MSERGKADEQKNCRCGYPKTALSFVDSQSLSPLGLS